MSIVHVNTEGGRYAIHIAPRILQQLATSIPENTTSIVLISNTTVMPLYGEIVKRSLSVTAKPLHVLELPDGEAFKNLETLNTIYTFLLSKGVDRKSVIVALGGGVIGDISGYAAATYMRGIRFIQVPTTLLAQVDSSVGGKTAVNHTLGKNMIGAFYQPIAVDIDVDVLKTLPEREISAGLAEVIKYGMILDADFFAWCEENVQKLRALDPDALSYAIHRSCELKAQVVSEDEKETGLRAILNLGHTFGHAIETALGYGTWLHGEAVGCGMVQAAELSAQVLGLPREDVERIRNLVTAIGCPVVAPNLGTNKWIELMKIDKKSEGGKIKFVLLPKIGEAVVRTVPNEDLGLVLSKTVK
ncbi:3-dehydroquinate synthase [Pelistega europaea]|uniref:3-dehydroquinate synthase n=1 Tax=Pelistega europaea TaxID=106147 RepID=A0A7Y4LA55_9BURK|nr:3-dehydroquinate synthase [Pelistega europaea]NOL48741.1 3-dehydroquinate synthase [Pelistega europaea]